MAEGKQGGGRLAFDVVSSSFMFQSREEEEEEEEEGTIPGVQHLTALHRRYVGS